MNGKVKISCPDCPRRANLNLGEVKKIVGYELFEKHTGFRFLAQIQNSKIQDSKRIQQETMSPGKFNYRCTKSTELCFTY